MKDETWMHYFKIAFWAKVQKKYITYEGTILGESYQAVLNQLTELFLDEDEEFDCVYIEIAEDKDCYYREVPEE